MTELLTSGLIMVQRADAGIAGAGFLISQDTAVTCTHVLANAGSPVPEEAFIRFYGDAAPHKVVIDAKYCRPAEAEDITFLRLIPSVKEKTPLPLGSSNGTNGHGFDTLGFPSVNGDGGVRGDGHVLGKVSINRIPVLQIDSKQVTPGFSGAPVLDTLTGRVIGMVTKIAVPDEYGRLRDVAFITPSESLRAVFPTLQIEDACPYRGLSSFTSDAEDVKFFCGRERLTSDLVAQLTKNPNFLAVVGPSGSGKSSAVNAGLVPAIRAGQAGFMPETLSVFPLSKVSRDDVLAAVNELDGVAKNGLCTHRNVFVLDELEQLFVASSDARVSLIPVLAKLVKDRPNFTLVTAFRSDFYDPVFNSALGPGLDVGQINVRLMSVDELKSAIATPATSVGLRFSEGLVDDIAADAAKLDNPLPLLEFALTQLWEQRNDGELTRSAYRQMKGVAGSLASWATDAFAQLSEGERKTAQHILLRLIHYGDGNTPDTRKRGSLADLVSAAQNQAHVLSVVMKLATGRILTTDRDQSTQRQTVGLIHDALITQWAQLATWIKEQREFLVWRQRLAARIEEWEKSGKDVGALLRGQNLNEALRWSGERDDDLSPAEASFIRDSLSLRDAEAKAIRDRELREKQTSARLKLGIMTAVVVVGAIIAGIWYWEKSQQAAALLRSRQLLLVGESQRLAPTLSSESMLLAVAALNGSYGADERYETTAISNLHSLLTKMAGSTVVVRQKGINAVAISPDGQYFASGEDDEGITVCTIQGASQTTGCKSLAIGRGPILFLGFGNSGHWLAVGSSQEWKEQVNGTFNSAEGMLENKLNIDLVDLTSDQFRVVSLPLADNVVHAASVSRDGRWLITGEDKGTVHMWDLGSDTPAQAEKEIQGHKFTVVSAAMSPDGRWIATGDEDHVLVMTQLGPDGTPLKSFTFREDEGRVSALAFSMDGEFLALGTGVALIHNASGGEFKDINALEANATIKIYDMRSGQPELQPDSSFTTGQDQIDQIAISSDGRWLAAGTHSGFFRWEPRSLVKQYKMSLRLWKIKDEEGLSGDTLEKSRFKTQTRRARFWTKAKHCAWGSARTRIHFFRGHPMVLCTSGTCRAIPFRPTRYGSTARQAQLPELRALARYSSQRALTER